jgi:hypothetical protein
MLYKLSIWCRGFDRNETASLKGICNGVVLRVCLRYNLVTEFHQKLINGGRGW